MEGTAYPNLSSRPLTTSLWKSNTFSVTSFLTRPTAELCHFGRSDFDGLLLCLKGKVSPWQDRFLKRSQPDGYTVMLYQNWLCMVYGGPFSMLLDSFYFFGYVILDNGRFFSQFPWKSKGQRRPYTTGSMQRQVFPAWPSYSGPLPQFSSSRDKRLGKHLNRISCSTSRPNSTETLEGTTYPSIFLRPLDQFPTKTVHFSHGWFERSILGMTRDWVSTSQESL